MYDYDPSHFTGKERDGETGNDNFGARYFGSGMGRFLSPDPSGISLANLADPQQLNLYSYVRNNPLSLTDPTGLDACSSQPFNNQGTEVNNDDCNSSTSQMGAPDPGPNLCTGNGCVTAGGVDIFDAISGRPGTFMTTDMYGNLHWGFSSDMWIAAMDAKDSAASSSTKVCTGTAHVLQGNAEKIGQPGGFSGDTAGQIIVTAGSAAVAPSQWGGKGAVRPFLSQISGVFPKVNASFQGVTDVIGSTDVPNVREQLMSKYPNTLLLELPSASRDYGTTPVDLTIPAAMKCPSSTE